jgi:cation:H+ antiporter
MFATRRHTQLGIKGLVCLQLGEKRMEAWVSVGLGLVLLLVGGELLVRGAVASATSLGLSPLLIGLMLVGFGTSTPELVTSVTGAPGIAVGNVVGSNIANFLYILALSAVIYPMAVNPNGFRRDAVMMVVATFLASLLAYGMWCLSICRKSAHPIRRRW